MSGTGIGQLFRRFFMTDRCVCRAHECGCFQSPTLDKRNLGNQRTLAYLSAVRSLYSPLFALFG